MAQVSVVIVNWYTEGFLADCLNALYKNTRVSFDVVVVDNNTQVKRTDTIASAQPSLLESITRKYGNVRLLKNGRNMGFAYAVNQGISASDGEYVLTLNPDVVLMAGYVDTLLEKMTSDKKIGAISGKLLNSFDERTLDSAGQIIYKNRFARDRGHGEKDTGQYGDGCVFGTCAAATLYRREMLNDIRMGSEYFDGDFFAYLEDVDLAWRAQARGWKFYFTGAAVACHRRAATSQSFLKKAKRKFLGWRNRWLMIIKNDSLFQTAANIPFMLLCPIRSVKMLQKRVFVQKNRQVRHGEIVKWFVPYFGL